MKNLWRNTLLVFLITIGMVNTMTAQDNFEIELKGGYAKSLGSNWFGNSGLGSNLNLGYQLNMNNFGLSIAYYRQHFNHQNNTYATQHYAFGIYYARTLISNPRFIARLGGAICLGGANTFDYDTYFDKLYSASYEGKFAPKIFINGYYLISNRVALSCELNAHMFSLSSPNANSGTIIFNALGGLTFILPNSKK